MQKESSAVYHSTPFHVEEAAVPAAEDPSDDAEDPADIPTSPSQPASEVADEEQAPSESGGEGETEQELAPAEPQRRYPKRYRELSVAWYRNQQARLHATEGLSDNPATYKEAMNRPDKDLWQAAIDEEMAALHPKKVYSEATLPEDTSALPSKLVLNIKRDEHGNVDKYKARLVAKGFRQVPGKDYDEVFAPTAQHVTFRVLMAFASAHGLEVEQLDVKTAFLNGELSEDVYLRLPKEQGGNIWLLHKSLYGLKQAGRAWHT
jgi:hypothetical protein